MLIDRQSGTVTMSPKQRNLYRCVNQDRNSLSQRARHRQENAAYSYQSRNVEQQDNDEQCTTRSVSLITDALQFEALRYEWQQLVEACPDTSIFQSWEWQYTWWQTFGKGKQLWLLLVYESQRLVGIGPFYRRWGQLRLIGDDRLTGGDFLDIIVTTPAIARQIAEYIFRQAGKWNVAVMHGLRRHSWFCNILLQDERFYHYCLPGHVCPIIPLPADHEQFISALGRRTRRNIRNYERRLFGQYNMCIEQVSGTMQMQNVLQKLMSLQGLRRNRLLKPSALDTRPWQQFHRHLLAGMADTSMVRLYRLRRDKETVAVCYCFVWKHQWYFYQAGFNNHGLPSHLSVVLVLLNRVIRDAIGESATTIHLLDGKTPFKQRLANAEVITETVVCAVLPLARMRVYLWKWRYWLHHRVVAVVPGFIKNRVKYVCSRLANRIIFSAKTGL